MDLAVRGNAPVVVGVDGSVTSLAAARWAADAAARRHAPLLLLHATAAAEAVAGVLPLSDPVRATMRARGEEIVADAARTTRDVATVATETRVVDEAPAAAMLTAATTARMVVIGGSSHAGFVSGLLLGSLATQLAAHAESPVAVVRGPTSWTPLDRPGSDAVLVGVDGSPLSTEAIGCAFEEAAVRDAPLIALHVWNDTDSSQVFSQVRGYFDWEPVDSTERRQLAERLAGWNERYPDVDVRREVVKDKPAAALLAASARAQLVVVGSRGRGGLGGLLLGSTSQALIHQAHCPVLVVRPTTRSP